MIGPRWPGGGWMPSTTIRSRLTGSRALTGVLSASATGQLYSSDQSGFEDSLIASLWLAMRLQY